MEMKIKGEEEMGMDDEDGRQGKGKTKSGEWRARAAGRMDDVSVPKRD